MKEEKQSSCSAQNEDVNRLDAENNGCLEFIGIVIHNLFVLPMSLSIDLTFRLPNRQDSSEQFLAMLPLQLQKNK